VRNAYELREDYGRDGKCTHRERNIGPIVPWCIVTSKAPAIPGTFWQLLKF